MIAQAPLVCCWSWWLLLVGGAFVVTWLVIARRRAVRKAIERHEQRYHAEALKNFVDGTAFMTEYQLRFPGKPVPVGMAFHPGMAHDRDRVLAGWRAWSDQYEDMMMPPGDVDNDPRDPHDDPEAGRSG
jgi:hypothetical protein